MKTKRPKLNIDTILNPGEARRVELDRQLALLDTLLALHKEQAAEIARQDALIEKEAA